MNGNDFITMIDRGCCAKSVVRQMIHHYEDVIKNTEEHNVCFNCIDRDVCNKLEWFDSNLKKASRDMLEDVIMKEMRCRYFTKKEND